MTRKEAHHTNTIAMETDHQRCLSENLEGIARVEPEVHIIAARERNWQSSTVFPIYIYILYPIHC